MSVFNLTVFEDWREVMDFSSQGFVPVMNISSVRKVVMRAKKPGPSWAGRVSIHVSA
jgi:hypothetical protein